jgi:glycosyltransferase involved in cell wall biosynthesis
VPHRGRIVVLSTFPIYPRLGGGQQRCFHLYKALTEDFDVEIVSLTGPHDVLSRVALGPGITETSVPKSPEHERREQAMADVGIPITDICAALFTDQTPNYRAAVDEAMQRAEVCIVAHPYLIQASLDAAPSLPIVYDAIDAEFDLKSSLLDGRGGSAPALLATVRRVEELACGASTLVVAASEADASSLRARYDLEPDRVRVIPNGVDVARVRFSSALERRRVSKLASNFAGGFRCNATALFIGSLHPPNIAAGQRILDMANEMPEFLFVLVGRHAEPLPRPFPSNVVALGAVGDAAKESLLRRADVGLNPVVSGTGTNLKLLEYFATGLPAVTTPLGARGIEVHDGHVAVCALERFPAVLHSLADTEVTAAARAVRARRLVEERYDWRELGRQLRDAVVAIRASR